MDELGDPRAVAACIVNAAPVALAFARTAEIREIEPAQPVEDEIVGAAQPMAVATLVEHGHRATHRIHAFNPAAGIVGCQARAARHAAFAAPHGAAVVAD